MTFDVALRAATALGDKELRALSAHPSDLPAVHDVGGTVSGELLARVARTVLALRIASRLSDELRDLEEPMLKPLRLAVEAARLVIERDALSPEREPFERACRAVLDSAWDPAPFDRIGSELPTEPTVLRPAEAHRLVDQTIAQAIALFQPTDVDDELDLLIAGNKQERERFRATLRSGAPDRVVGVLRTHRAHFPGEDEVEARKAIITWADPAIGAHLSARKRHARARRAILQAWGCPEKVLKHFERSVQRRK